MRVGLLESGAFMPRFRGTPMRLFPRATTALSFVSILVLGMRGALAGTPPELSRLDALYPSLDALYQDLHRSPELSNREEKTAAKMAARLREVGFEVTEHVGGNGVVGVLRNGAGPTVLVALTWTPCQSRSRRDCPTRALSRRRTTQAKQ